MTQQSQQSPQFFHKELYDFCNRAEVWIRDELDGINPAVEFIFNAISSRLFIRFDNDFSRTDSSYSYNKTYELEDYSDIRAISDLWSLIYSIPSRPERERAFLCQRLAFLDNFTKAAESASLIAIATELAIQRDKVKALTFLGPKTQSRPSPEPQALDDEIPF